MKEAFLFLEIRLVSKKHLGLIFSFFVLALCGYCQAGKTHVDINRIFESEVKRLLLPSHLLETHAPTCAIFLEHPQLNPDYSICLKDSAKHFFLELRILDKNLWKELLTGIMQKKNQTVSLKACVYSTSVSRSFKMTMLKAFDKINPVKADPHHVVQYDGITFEFIYVKKGRMKKIPILYELKSESYESVLIKILDQISNDLVNYSFTEIKYRDRLK